MFVLAVASAGQARPDVAHLFDRLGELARLDQRQCAALPDLLQRDQVLAQRREVLQAQRLPVGVVIAAQQLVAACGGGLDAQLRQRHQDSRMVGISVEQLATDDHVIATVFGWLLAVVGPFGPGQHVEKGHDVHAASLLGSDLRHSFSGKKKPRLGRGLRLDGGKIAAFSDDLGSHR
ncbi:hypothetical protein D3C73_1281080 [compost metagenome]